MAPRLLHDLAEQIGSITDLDAVAEPLTAFVKRVVPPHTAIKDALSGTALGHPLHPLLTDIPIGCFTSVSVLDVVGGRKGRAAADRLLRLGLAAAVPTALAGAADWSDTYGATKRIGVVHAASNATGLSFYALSALARRRGHRTRGALYALCGMSAMTVGGYLGGHLSYTRGVGMNRTADVDRPQEWTALDEVAEVLVVGDQAVAARCSHAGGDLRDGAIDVAGGTVTCPLHASVFRLDTGTVVHGPATVPQPAYDVRVVDGRTEVRARR
jgi:nitrite reductase/ring-hydroxylating ferredoxin subunit/uncharacterized membrane protein